MTITFKSTWFRATATVVDALGFFTDNSDEFVDVDSFRFAD
jgi:hypothetical protein